MSRREELEGELSSFIRLAIAFGQSYLSCGGPTSRLESRLTSAAKQFGFECEIFAIPTGIFVSASHPDLSTPLTTNARVKDLNYNLFALNRLEELLSAIVARKTTFDEATEKLRQESFFGVDYPKWLLIASPFLFGTAITLPLLQAPYWSWLGGLITFLVSFLRQLMANKLQINQTVSDFLSSWLAFALAAAASKVFPVTPESMVFGSLILMVPGLTLTTAVSELAENNYVSGVTKLVQGGLTILSMGLAYLLFQEFFASLGAGKFGISGLQLGEGWDLNFWIGVSCLVLAVTSFAATVNVPPKCLPIAALIGFCGLLVIKSLNVSGYLVSGVFIASFVVGILSLFFGRVLRLPSQIFSVPGIIALVPGLMSLSIFNYVAFENFDMASPVLIKVILTSTAIVFGLFTARIPFTLLKSFKSEEFF